MTRYRLTLNTPDAAVTATDAAARTLTGVAIPYGEVGHTSMGTLTVQAGAVRIPDNLSRVKLFREHGRTAPLGPAIAATDSPEALRMTFRVTTDPEGDAALLQASDGRRDGLSVELDEVRLDGGVVTDALLVAVAQVAVPAFPSAVLTASDAPEPPAESEPPALAAAAGDTVTVAVTGTLIEPPADAPAEAPPADVPAASTRGETMEQIAASLPVGMVPARTRAAAAAPRSLHEFSQVMAGLMTGATDAAQVNAALNDITKASGTSSTGASDAFPRPQWLDELWRAVNTDRPMVNAVGSQPLTGMVLQGWKWNVAPIVQRYGGDKAAVPSNPATISPAEAPAYRLAGGWDFDRIYEDFNTGFIASFLEAAVADYAVKSESALAAGLPAVTGPPALPAVPGMDDVATDIGASTGVGNALSKIISTLTVNGARLSFLAMASDVFAKFLDTPAASIPWWMNSTIDNKTTVDTNLTIGLAPALGAGLMVGGDSRAISYRETGPFRVQAINLPNGGIDAGVFGYAAQLLNDARGLVKTTVTLTELTTASAKAK